MHAGLSIALGEGRLCRSGYRLSLVLGLGQKKTLESVMLPIDSLCRLF